MDAERFAFAFDPTYRRLIHESTDVVMLVGSDAGVSFRSVHDPGTRVAHSVVSNTSDGAWPLTRYLGGRLGTG